MIAYKIQLRYVIRDKIQSKTKFNLRKNLGIKKIVGKKLSEEKKIVRKKMSQILSRTDSNQSELSLTNQCLSSLSGTHRNNILTLISFVI